MNKLGLVLAILLSMPLLGCNVRQMAINQLADALSASSSGFSSDPDPELVRDALPFSMKLLESILAETPEHQPLLLATSSAFTQYAYAFVQLDADYVEETDFEQAMAMRLRARDLFLRGRDYGLRGLAVSHPGFTEMAFTDPVAASAMVKKKELVPLLYWTAAAWGSAVSLSKNDPELVAQQLAVEALIDRASVLDESLDDGAIPMFLMAYELSRQGAGGDPYERARRHFDRAMVLSEGKQASPLVTYAEVVSVAKQDRAEFVSLLERALLIDPHAAREFRLANLLMQRRAKWLLERADDLFLD